jgi:hypothetical protein
MIHPLPPRRRVRLAVELGAAKERDATGGRQAADEHRRHAARDLLLVETQLGGFERRATLVGAHDPRVSLDLAHRSASMNW